ncbi:MAG TPA: hypothetical protein ENN68_02150 [Methanomicrobia archaeon]|nr:hypothetical protein [Methanomicrobia archaeon]
MVVIIPRRKTIRMMRNANHEACWPEIQKKARRVRTVVDDTGARFVVYRISGKELMQVMIKHRTTILAPRDD